MINEVGGTLLLLFGAEIGAGFYNAGTGFVTETLIQLNEAGLDGGGIFTASDGVTILNDSSLINNSPNDEKDE